MKEVQKGKFYRFFYPSVPAILSSSHGRTVSAMPVVSFTSLSESPPIVGVSSSRSHRTYKTALASRRFSLCWLDLKESRAVEQLALHSGTEFRDKLSAAGLKHHRGRSLDVPVIDSAVAVLECSLVKTMRFGDHSFLVGNVLDAYATDDFREYWEFRTYQPILYTGWRGGLSTLHLGQD